MISESRRRFTGAKILGVICLLVLSGILVAGLWPFHAPKNEVAWSGNENGLRFGDYGDILTNEEFRAVNFQDPGSCSLEVWLIPGLTFDTNTFVAFYTAENPLQFSLHQSNEDLALRRATRDAYGKIIASRIYVDRIFRQGRPVFITITSNTQQTRVYVDGVLSKDSPQFRLSAADLTGRLVVANSPVRNDSWSGELRGLAIYHRALTDREALQDFESWEKAGKPAAAGNGGRVALFLFSERSGSIIHNQMSGEPDLYIPTHYTVLHQILLEPFWKEFNLSWGYWKNVLINIGGFIPLGFFFCAWLSSFTNPKRAALITIALGFATSFTIETLQAFLPSRDSGMTDIITNTLGTCIGVGLYRVKPIQALLAQMLDRIPFRPARYDAAPRQP